jgi:bzd-type benzoyl-CoA reductase N subunit
MDITEKFSRAAQLPNSWIDDWKNQGKKVFGYFCSYIPEEILYAAEILPIRIRALGCTETPMGDAYMSNTTCSFTRCCLDMAHNNQFDYLDGIISCNSCDQIRRLYDNIKFKAPFPFQYFLSLPSNINEITIEWFEHELMKFKEKLEGKFDINITNKKLKDAIIEYNKSRRFLKKLYESRNRYSPAFNGTEIMNIVLAGNSIPRDIYNNLLNQLLEKIDIEEGISEYKARLMLIGSDLDDPEYIKIIEDLGGLVVSDFLCFGSRYFWDLVNEEENPIKALAQRYISKISCPRMAGEHKSRIEFVKNLIKTSYVDGVILQRMKFCPFWWGENFIFHRELRKLGVPCLHLEREYILSGVGPMKTRIQAFLEALEEE